MVRAREPAEHYECPRTPEKGWTFGLSQAKVRRTRQNVIAYFVEWGADDATWSYG